VIQTIEPDYKHWDEEYAKYINSLKLVWLLGDEQKVQGDIRLEPDKGFEPSQMMGGSSPKVPYSPPMRGSLDMEMYPARALLIMFGTRFCG